MGSPIESWEGAAAIFTGAHNSLSIWLFLLLAAVATVVPLIDSARHESHAYEKNGK